MHLDGPRGTVDIDPEVRQILLQATVKGRVLFLPPGLDRNLYVRVNKVLEALGGKWNRKEGGHVFEGDPFQALMNAVSTGHAVDVKKTVEFFETPEMLARELVLMAAIGPGMKVLEPSAGRGAIADAVRAACPDCRIETIEPEKKNRAVLKEKGYRLVGSDFMKFKRKGYDRIVMNPPFSRQQDIDHVTHAYKLLAPGGRLVSVMAASVQFRTNKKTKAFQELVAGAGTVAELPPETFRESGTLVNTVVVTLVK